MKIKITDAHGWTKTVDLPKAITTIGNAPHSDFQLSLRTNQQFQLQILSHPELPSGLRVVNLDSDLVMRKGEKTFPLTQFMMADLNNGDEIEIGEYEIAFEVPLITATLRSSKNIEAQLSFPDTILQPNLNLEGRLTIRNSGEKDACQFQVTLQGIPNGCYQIDPIPLLHPGAHEEIGIRLIHNIVNPPAGVAEVIIKITAQAAYPGDEFIIRQGIYVTPFFKQSLVFTEEIPSIREPIPTDEVFKKEGGTAEPLPGEGEFACVEDEATQTGLENVEAPIKDIGKLPQKVEKTISKRVSSPTTSPVSENKSVSEKPFDQIENIDLDTLEKKKSKPTQELDLSKIKVMRTQKEEFWNEEG